MTATALPGRWRVTARLRVIVVAVVVAIVVVIVIVVVVVVVVGGAVVAAGLYQTVPMTGIDDWHARRVAHL